jgi:hypothetical protein
LKKDFCAFAAKKLCSSLSQQFARTTFVFRACKVLLRLKYLHVLAAVMNLERTWQWNPMKTFVVLSMLFSPDMKVVGNFLIKFCEYFCSFLKAEGKDARAGNTSILISR